MPLRAILFASAALAASAGAGQAFTLNVLHFNDFHSRIESINAFDSTCSAEDEAAGECFGGAARLVTAINGLRDELKADGGNVVVWDAATLDVRSRLQTGERGMAHPFFSPDASLLAAGCQANGDVVIWNLAQRQEAGRFTFEKGALRTYMQRPAGAMHRPEEDPTRFCFSPSGEAFLAGAYGGILRCTTGGQELRRFGD